MASASASTWSTFCAMRSKVSKEELADREPMVCWICFCASALLARAIEEVLLAAGLFDLGLELPQRVFELFDGGVLAVELLLE